MSSEEGDSGPGRREVAYRLFAAEFDDSDYSYAESDEERAPNYVVTPTGARVNRVFVVGVLTEVEPVGDDVLRARIVDPTGAFVVYAGQYQPDAKTFLERAQAPAFVAVSGKARTFQPEDSEVVYTSIRPESVNEVDADTRDRWTVQTAEQTLDRIGVTAAALAQDSRGDDLRAALEAEGVDEALAAGIPLALDHYGTTGAYLSALADLSVEALGVVAGDRDEVGSLSLSPDQGDEGDLTSLAAMDLQGVESDESEPAEPPAGEPSTDDSRAGTAAESTASETVADETESAADTADSETSEKVETTTSESEPSTTETETEPATTDASDEADDEVEPEPVGAVDTESDDLGDFETSDAGSAGDPGDFEPAEDPGDFEPGEFDLDEETREEVESEFGTDFQSGAEVDEPGEADIDTPDPEDIESAAEAGAPADAADAEPAPESAGAPAGDESATPDAEAATSDAVTETPDTTTDAGADEVAGEDEADDEAAEPADDVDLEDLVMDAMEELDEGDGASREGVVAAVVEQSGADADAVEDAIQAALMDGRCYEPDDTTLKSI